MRSGALYPLRSGALTHVWHRVCPHHVIHVGVAVHSLWPKGAVFIPSHELLVFETQHAFIYLLVVLTDEGSRLDVESRSLVEFEGSILELA